MPRSPLRLLSLTLAALAPLAFASAASAEPLPRLAVHRAPEASACPDAPALDPDDESPAAPVYAVRLSRSSDGYSAVLQYGDLSRKLEDPGATCDALADALALTLAILLDAAPSRRPALLLSLPLGSLAELVERRPRLKTWEVSLDIGAVGVMGLSPLASAAGIGEVSLRIRRISFGAGALWLPTTTRSVEPGVISLSLVAATARVCADPLGPAENGFRVSLCAQPMLGALHGQGRGYHPDRQGTAPWFALGVTALGEGTIAGPVGWSARATLLPLIASPSFTVDQARADGETPAVTTTTVYSPASVGFLLGAGLRVSIP